MSTFSKTILIVCNRVPFPLKDGGALAMYAMIEGWQQQAYQVHLLAMNTSRHFVQNNQLPELFTQLASCTLVPVNNDIRVLPTMLNFFCSNKPQHADRFYHKHFAQSLRAIVEKINPDFVQLESIYLQEYVPALRQYSNAKIIQRLHNIEAEIWERLAGETKHWAKQFYLRNLAQRIKQYEQMVWRSSDALITISKEDEKKIRHSNCSTPCKTIGFGLSQMPDVPAVQQGSMKAYHLGAMDWQPNIDAMDWMQKEISPRILAQKPDFDFQFAGRNMPAAFLSHTEQSFYCVGEVADAASFIQDKDILIVPLRSGSGIRIKSLEAMAAGKLVVSTSIGMQGLNVQDRVHYLKADTAEDFVIAIKWVSQNPEAAQKIREQARAYVQEQHNLPVLMKELVHFIENL